MNVFIFEHQETKEILEINAETMREAMISLLRILENERKIKWSDVLIDRFEEWIPVDVRKDNINLRDFGPLYNGI